jgi:hypothetical protein
LEAALKIALPKPRERTLFDPPPAPRVVPLRIDAIGAARAVVAAPTTEAAWLALTDRLPPGGAYLAARLTATHDRAAQAGYALGQALLKIGERRTTTPGPLPPVWVARLADLAVEELDALWALDDAAHAAAVEPAWVEVESDSQDRPGRAVPAEELSWARVARLLGRTVQCVAGLADADAVWDRMGAIDVGRELDAADLDAIKDKCRETVRWAIGTKYGAGE